MIVIDNVLPIKNKKENLDLSSKLYEILKDKKFETQKHFELFMKEVIKQSIRIHGVDAHSFIDGLKDLMNKKHKRSAILSTPQGSVQIVYHLHY